MLLAKIKLRIGDNEIEIDSRDFYVDNHTIGKVIENITMLLQESSARIMPYSTKYGMVIYIKISGINFNFIISNSEFNFSQ